MHLDPGHAVHYTWQEPVSQRELVWHCKEFCMQSSSLLEVSFQLFSSLFIKLTWNEMPVT
jgi:hypothetical protein